MFEWSRGKPFGCWTRLGLGVVVLVGTLGVDGRGLVAARAEGESPYRITQMAVRVAPGTQYDPVVSGKWVLWRDQADQKRIAGRNLETGGEMAFNTSDYLEEAPDVDGDTVVAAEAAPNVGYGIFGYRLPDAQRFVIAPFKTAAGGFSRKWAAISGRTVVWAEVAGRTSDIYGYDITGQRLFTVSAHPAYQDWPAVSGSYVVWRDDRHAPPMTPGQPLPNVHDVYGYDLATGQELRISSRTETMGPPAVSGSVVVWAVQRPNAVYLLAYDIARRQELTIAQLPVSAGLVHPAIDGDLVVWNGPGEWDEDIFGYDLKQQTQFVISRAAGAQRMPKVSERTVVWGDNRHSGVGKYEFDVDIYGARLELGPGPMPPATGIPSAVDAKIEIVWPHGNAPVMEAERANIGAWLFLPGTMHLTACQWQPQVQLWKALNNEPAKLIAVGQLQGDRYYKNNRGVPTWEFNDVDVAAAQDPNNKIYFFVTVEGVPGRTNVWSHGADARTHFPRQDVPAGLAAAGDAVEAKIEIVWPHDNAPVEQAKLVNVSAMLFAPGTSMSVPADWNRPVRLYRALNNSVSQEVGIGQKRLVTTPSFTHPVWDFDDVDVSAAIDPANKYYFTLAVDGITTHTNVWAHGADARTYFPLLDGPEGSCG
ncbi:MAG: hypothetical protein HY675_21805 [Chloroflexi bacterium]|nr:hypothetical protein [Chloroflexota bacterium]